MIKDIKETWLPDGSAILYFKCTTIEAQKIRKTLDRVRTEIPLWRKSDDPRAEVFISTPRDKAQEIINKLKDITSCNQQ
jgi:hypothetical protein